MHFLIGLIIVAIIIYIAFIRKETDTDEESLKKVAQTAIVLAIICAILVLLSGL